MESQTTTSGDDQLENLSNLLINSSSGGVGGTVGVGGGGGGGGGEAALIEQYEYDMDKALNENLMNEKEQMNQRLFQSFQTSACMVAQMFKDKSAAPQPQISSWQAFQNAAGAITVLYKDSLESCKTHYELGIAAGQQRKLKEILNWVKKKKRRAIRKDELLSFLLGRQWVPLPEEGGIGANGMTSMDHALSGMQAGVGVGGGGGSGGSTMFMMPPSSHHQSSMFAASKQPFLFRSSTASSFMQQHHHHQQQQQQQTQQHQQQQQSQQSQSNLFGLPFQPAQLQTQSQQATARPPSATPAPGLVGVTTAGTGDTSSDLATFREALIMHNRSRDHMPPLQPTYASHNHPSHHSHHHHHHQHNHHSHQHHHPTTAQQQQQQQQQQPCDDLDCFFCEQIATHVEHKRSASQNSNLNGGSFDMESPTRKRGRFY